MGCRDHPGQGLDSDPLQARNHHLGICRLQHLAVYLVLNCCARRAVLHSRCPAQQVRRLHSGRAGKAVRPVGCHWSRCPGARILYRIPIDLTAVVRGFAGWRLWVTFDLMPDRVGQPMAQSRSPAATLAAALSMLVMAAGAGWPQAAPPPQTLGLQTPAPQAAPPPPPILAAPQQEPAPSSPSPAQDENPGLINEIGKLWEKSKTILPTLKSPQEAFEDFNTRAKDVSRDAGESLSRLAKPSLMVSGRMGCPVSANGAPDCKAGADKLCQAKGHKEGKSLDTDAAEKCSAKVYLPGRKRGPGDCRTENYVTRALCQ